MSISIAGILPIILIVVVVLILLGIIASGYVKAPPDTAFIITRPKKQRTLIGKAGFRIPGLDRVDKIPLSLIQVMLIVKHQIKICLEVELFLCLNISYLAYRRGPIL